MYGVIISPLYADVEQHKLQNFNIITISKFKLISKNDRIILILFEVDCIYPCTTIISEPECIYFKKKEKYVSEL